MCLGARVCAKRQLFECMIKDDDNRMGKARKSEKKEIPFVLRTVDFERRSAISCYFYNYFSLGFPMNTTHQLRVSEFALVLKCV